VKVISLPDRRSPSARTRRAASPGDLGRLAARLRQPAERSDDGRLVVEAMTPLPTEHGLFDVRLFRFDGGSEDHLAISCGDLSGPDPVPVRIHSECFTGEVLNSRRCECAGQLAYALEHIHAEGRGVVVYLRQEGRGIGLANKLRAYRLQAEGADTVDANRLLGLPDDARSYEAAAAVLRHLGIRRVCLLTNNPSKIRSMESLGFEVSERRPVIVAQDPIARRYLESKRDRMEHLVPEQLPLLADGEPQ
jgi:GTP cyclohydrolase II